MTLSLKSLFAVLVALFCKFTFAQNLESVLANLGWNTNKTYECVLFKYHHGPSFDSLKELHLSRQVSALAHFEGRILVAKWHPGKPRPEGEVSFNLAQFSGDFDNQGHPVFLAAHRHGVNRLTMWRVGSHIIIGDLSRGANGYITYLQHACS